MTQLNELYDFGASVKTERRNKHGRIPVKVFFLPTPPFLPCEGHQPTSFDVLVVTLLPGSVGLGLRLGLHLPRSPVPNSGCRSYFRQSRIL